MTALSMDVFTVSAVWFWWGMGREKQIRSAMKKHCCLLCGDIWVNEGLP